MLYKIMVMLHVFGASVWIGGHIVLVAVVLPNALRNNEPRRITEFENGYGRLGLASLVIQLLSGLWLADRWIGDWSRVFTTPNPVSHLILAKITLLVITVGLAGYAYHKVLPGIERGTLKRFSILAWTTTLLAILLLIFGAGARTGGLF